MDTYGYLHTLNSSVYEGTANLLTQFQLLKAIDEMDLKESYSVRLHYIGDSKSIPEMLDKIPEVNRLAHSGSKKAFGGVFKTSVCVFTAMYDITPGDVNTITFTFYGDREAIEKHLLSNGFVIDLDKDEETSVVFAFAPEDRLTTVYKQYKNIDFASIEKNYGESTRAGVRKVIKELSNPEINGLVIINGPVGTGKTYALQSILSEVAETRQAVVCVPPSIFLERAHLLAGAISEFENVVVVLEDVGVMFAEDSKERYADHFSNLVNITDGLLSLLGNVTFIMTFNYNIDKMDAALVRHGRCIAQVEFPNLTYHEALARVDSKYHKSMSKNNSYSLAELYAITGEVGDYRFTKPQTRVGLGARD